MKKYFLFAILFLSQITLSIAAEKLPAPNMNDPFLNMLSNRKTSREFNSTKQIDDNTLSDILWAAYGINRKEENKRTIPTAKNIQDLEIYVIKKDGAYLYSAETNELKQVSRRNLFKYFSDSQKFVDNADIILVYATKDFQENSSAMHAGSAYQNVAIYCAEHNMPNVVKGMMNKRSIARDLNIKEKDILVSQVIGLN